MQSQFIFNSVIILWTTIKPQQMIKYFQRYGKKLFLNHCMFFVSFLLYVFFSILWLFKQLISNVRFVNIIITSIWRLSLRSTRICIRKTLSVHFMGMCDATGDIMRWNKFFLHIPSASSTLFSFWWITMTFKSTSSEISGFCVWVGYFFFPSHSVVVDHLTVNQCFSENVKANMCVYIHRKRLLQSDIL